MVRKDQERERQDKIREKYWKRRLNNNKEVETGPVCMLDKYLHGWQKDTQVHFNHTQWWKLHNNNTFCIYCVIVDVWIHCLWSLMFECIVCDHCYVNTFSVIIDVWILCLYCWCFNTLRVIIDFWITSWKLGHKLIKHRKWLISFGALALLILVR